MDYFFLYVYAVLLILQIAFLVVCMRKKRKKLWIALGVAEMLILAVSMGFSAYYEKKPDTYMFEYFGEALLSYFASIAYGFVILVSIGCYFVSKKMR